MADRIKVARLREEQIDAATRLVTEVFLIQLRVVGFEPDHEQQRSYRDGFLRLVRFFFAHGEPYAATIDGEVVGVALWMPPHTLETADEEAQEFGVTQLTDIFREPLGRLYELDRKLRDIREENMKAPHWFIALLNISPARRGQGISKALLQPLLLRADEGELPCYAETVLPDMVPFFERYGFAILAQGVDTSSGAPWWALRREPKPLPEQPE
ncbi:MAG TPA: GNAT family N-acetyltransferase [Candidatus Binataceae bacterium]|nr:GNAT family N-acetyltransferase [Candidatus Binataceae bacterium]